MKTNDSVKHHKTHKHTVSGFVFGGILLALSACDVYLLKKPLFHPLSVYITLVPGILLILRSLRPHIGPLRIVMTYVGGTLTGITPMLLTSDKTQVLWMGLICGLVGATLIGIGFSIKPTDG